ncbi:MAG: hypothetical protein GC150_15285 [Rhizobiales bacterium]|nr:hypothetical protein [Hyphomicrobiales bacterium]
MSGSRFLTVLASMLLALLGGAYAMHSWQSAPTSQGERPATSLAGLDSGLAGGASADGARTATDVTGLPPVLSFRTPVASAPAGEMVDGAGHGAPSTPPRPLETIERLARSEPVAPLSEAPTRWPSPGPIASPVPEGADAASQSVRAPGSLETATNAEGTAADATEGALPSVTGPTVGSDGTVVAAPLPQEPTSTGAVDAGLPQPTPRSFERAEEIAREANRRFTEVLQQFETGASPKTGSEGAVAAPGADEVPAGGTTGVEVADGAPSQAGAAEGTLATVPGARLAEAEGLVGGSATGVGTAGPAGADDAAPQRIEFPGGEDTRQDPTGILSRAADLASETGRRVADLWRRFDQEGDDTSKSAGTLATGSEAVPSDAGTAMPSTTETAVLDLGRSAPDRTETAGSGTASTVESATAGRERTPDDAGATVDTTGTTPRLGEDAARDAAEFANETLREIERQVERERLAAIEAAQQGTSTRAPEGDGALPRSNAARDAAHPSANALSIADARIEAGADGRANVSASGRAVPGARLDVFVNGAQVASTVASDAGNWRLERALDRPLGLGGHAIEVRHTDAGLAIAEQRSRSVAFAPTLPERLPAGGRDALAQRRLAALQTNEGSAATAPGSASTSGAIAGDDSAAAVTPMPVRRLPRHAHASPEPATGASNLATRRAPVAKRQVRHRAAAHRARRKSSRQAVHSTRRTEVVRLATRAARRHRVEVRRQRSSMLQHRRHRSKRVGGCPGRELRRFVRIQVRRLDRLQLSHIGWRARYH